MEVDSRADRRHVSGMRWPLLVVLVSVMACEEPDAETQPPPPPPVRVELTVMSEVTPTAEGVATIEAAASAILRAETPGRILAFEVNVGDAVEEGAVIARLDVGRAAVALRAASAQVSQAEAQVAAANRQRALAARLVASGGAAQARLDDAEDSARFADAALRSARAQTQVTRRGLTEAVIRAPFAGVIAERLLSEGELASPGAPIVLLVDTTELEARVLLDPRRALDVAVGARATLRAPARPDEVFEAHVLRVGGVVDARTRRLPVELRIDDPDSRLRAGLVARFFVETEEPRQALLVPSDAVFERYGQPHVFVIADDQAERRAVELGQTHGDAIEVLGGLSVGTQIIVAGLDRVVHQRPVNVVEALAEAGDEVEAQEPAPAP